MAKTDFGYGIGRLVAGAFYDYQATRLSSMNRLRGMVREKNEGLDLSSPEGKKKEKKYDKKYADNSIFSLLREMRSGGKINAEEMKYVEKLEDLFTVTKQMESEWKNVMEWYICDEELWTDWLDGVRGISTVLTANLLKEFGYCESFEKIGGLWKFCGLHVVCPTCTMKVYDERREEYKTTFVATTADGKCPKCGGRGIAPKRRKKVSLDYSPKARVLCYKLGDSFVKQRTPYYRGIYDTEKARQLKLMETKAKNAPERLLQAELRARRKMVKLFLAHFWFVGRKMKGMETRPTYPEEKLGHTGIVMPKYDEVKGGWAI